MLREVPNYTIALYAARSNKYALCIPVINEGARIRKQVRVIYELGLYKSIDVYILDGGSTDNSLEEGYLREHRITGLLTKTDVGKLGAQLRMGFDYCLKEGYEGVITVDGNGKDGLDAVPDFICKLEEGYDFIQGSRFVDKGVARNTPLSRFFAIKLIHAPFISFLASKRFTDTTNGFRGHSAHFLRSANIFRKIFSEYELLFYLSVASGDKRYRATEIPVTRSYKKNAKIVTKISFWGNFKILWTLFRLARGDFSGKKGEYDHDE